MAQGADAPNKANTSGTLAKANVMESTGTLVKGQRAGGKLTEKPGLDVSVKSGDDEIFELYARRSESDMKVDAKGGTGSESNSVGSNVMTGISVFASWKRLVFFALLCCIALTSINAEGNGNRKVCLFVEAAIFLSDGSYLHILYLLF